MKEQDKYLKRLCRLMHDNSIQINVYDYGHGLKICWQEMENKEDANELEDLVYREGETGRIISKLPDGIYGAMQLWNAAKGGL